MPRVVFHARANTTSETVKRRLVSFFAAHREGQVVNHRAVFGMLAGQDVIEQGAFVKIGRRRTGLPFKNMLRQFQHIIDVAGLRGLFTEAVVQMIRLAEMFVQTIAASDVGMMIHHPLPEKLRGIKVIRVAGQFVKVGQAKQFWNLGIGVETVEMVLSLSQRCQHRLVIKALRQFQIFPVARVRVKIGQHLVHAAMLAGQNFLHLIMVNDRQSAMDEIRQLARHRQRLGIAAKPIRIPQAGHFLVQRVKRHPAAVQVEAFGSDDATADFGKNSLAVGNRGDVAVAVGTLAHGEFVHDVFDPLPQFFIARRLIHFRAGGKIMSEGMSGDAARFPAAINCGLGRQPGFLAKPCEQTIRFKFQQIIMIQFLRMFERPIQQAHVRKLKGHRFRCDHRFDHGGGANGSPAKNSECN